MAGPTYHGRTHAPGGTDPIPAADPIPGPGASSFEELYDGTGASITSGVATNLSFGANIYGASLLSLTSPTAPTIVTSGTYAFAVTPGCLSGSQPGKLWGFSFGVDVGGALRAEYVGFTAFLDSQGTPSESVAITRYLTAGASLVAIVKHNAGSSLTIAVVTTVIQRLS